MNYKKVMSLGATVLLAAALVGCSGGETESDSAAGQQEVEVVNQEIVAIVNDEAISKTELDESLEYMKTTYAQQGINIEETGELEELQLQALDQLVNTKLIMQEIAKSDFEPSADQINEEMDEITNQFETEEEMDELLQANNLTIDQLKGQISEDLKFKNFLSENTSEVEVSDEELRALYDQYSAGNEEFPEYEQIKEMLSEEVVAQKEQQQLMKLVENLKKDSEIEILI